MKLTRILTIAIVALSSALITSCSSESKKHQPNEYFGVWAGKNCEVLHTSGYVLLFSRDGENINTTLMKADTTINPIAYTYVSQILFDNVAKTAEPLKVRQPIQLSLIAGGKMQLSIGARLDTLTQIEKIIPTAAYEKLTANSSNVGQCLQEWPMGTIVTSMDTLTNNIQVEIGTNQHSYIFCVNPNTVYCRAARIRSNNNGSVFAQNIRLMSNAREFTAKMSANNLTLSGAELVIDDLLFTPDECHFAEGGKIYWSFISAVPDTIKINGCGETYTISRPQKNSKAIAEWFEYKPY